LSSIETQDGIFVGNIKFIGDSFFKYSVIAARPGKQVVWRLHSGLLIRPPVRAVTCR